MSYRGTDDWQGPLRRWVEAPLPKWAWGVGGFVCGFATCFLALVP
jgi:hypothetical protein